MSAPRTFEELAAIANETHGKLAAQGVRSIVIVLDPHDESAPDEFRMGVGTNLAPGLVAHILSGAATSIARNEERIEAARADAARRGAAIAHTNEASDDSAERKAN